MARCVDIIAEEQKGLWKRIYTLKIKQAQAFAPNINIYKLYCLSKPGSTSGLNKKRRGTVQVITGIQLVGGRKVSLVIAHEDCQI